MRWFVLSSNSIAKNEYKLSNEDFHYLSRVRRLQPGERISLIVDEKVERDVEVKALEDGVLSILPLSERLVQPVVPAEITLIQGLPKQDKMSDILNGCTQIGVSNFMPVEMQRCIVSYSDKQKSKKLERWCEIVRSASLQSFQVKEPNVNTVFSWKRFLSDFDTNEFDLLLVAWEDEDGCSLKETLEKVRNRFPKIALVIGPEGGLTKDEVNDLQRIGFVSVSLGGTILRTETAGLVGCSQIFYHFS